MATNRRVSGLYAKKAGEGFENRMKEVCGIKRVTCVRFPDGCKQLGAQRIVRVKTPFDWILSHKGRIAFLDTKRTTAVNFSASMVEEHQVATLLELQQEGHVAGYVVNFNSPTSHAQRTVFFTAYQLAQLTRGSSLPPDAGVDLGDGYVFEITRIWPVAQLNHAVDPRDPPPDSPGPNG